ncbi:MAG: VOC family protein [Chloroflexi bacterium]|nr:VOC family protein [Chloroflexota bacterium]
MTRIRGLAEIVLWVHEIERSLGFYQGVLGLQRLSPPEMKSPVFLQAGPPNVGIPQLVVLVQLPPDAGPFQKPRTLHHLALELAPEDFDPEAERLRGLGFSLRTGKHPVVPSRTMYVDDPDGNEVELICTAPAS